MATFSAVVLKGKIHVRSDKKSNVKIRITQFGKPAYISTDIYVFPKKFRKGAYSGDDAFFINEKIRDKIGAYERQYHELGRNGMIMTAIEIKKTLLAGEKKEEDIDFLKFIYDYMKELEAEGKTGSMSPVKTLYTHLTSFTSKLTFKQVDLAFLTAFEKHLRKVVKSKTGEQSSINNYMRYFRLVFYEGKKRFNDEESGSIRIPQNPFSKIEIGVSKPKSKQNSLTIDEIKALKNYIPTEGEEFAKDMAMLMFYLIGINTKDLFHLKKPISGRVTFDRFKTGREYSIRLEPEAIEIISRYPGEGQFLIDANKRYTNYRNFTKYVNIQLHGDPLRNVTGIFPALGINKQVTTNWFRHSWATIARNDCNIHKDDVALCLGHEDQDNKVTDMYINYDYTIIDSSNRKVIDKLHL